MEASVSTHHEKEVDAEKWLFLFYEHIESSPYSYSMYKIDIHLPTTTTTPPPPFKRTTIPPPPDKILDFPKDKFPAEGMRCAQLGSKIYFLGGTNNQLYGEDRDFDKLFPRDVYKFNILTGKFKKMEAQLISGKPHPCAVFAANGKLYALGTNAYYCDFLASLCLFECYDPETKRWQPLENFPFSNKENVYWEGSTILEKHQEVIVIGSTSHYIGSSSFKLVYNLGKNSWTRQDLYENRDREIALSLREGGGDDFYFLGVHCMPMKSKRSCINCLDELTFSYEGGSSEGLVEISIPQVSEYRNTYFYQSYDYCATKSLIYLGNDCFCYVASRMLPTKHDSFDPYTREVLLTLFKELKGDDEKLCFEAQILNSAYHTIKMPQDDKFCNVAQLVASFFVNPEILRKQKKREQTNIIKGSIIKGNIIKAIGDIKNAWTRRVDEFSEGYTIL